jgi:hypothetical protein
VCIGKALLERMRDRVWKISNDFTKLILSACLHELEVEELEGMALGMED